MDEIKDYDFCMNHLFFNVLFTAPSITFQVSSGNLALFWDEEVDVLQQSSDLSTWSDVDGASSPFSTPVNASPSKYYRLKR